MTITSTRLAGVELRVRPVAPGVAAVLFAPGGSRQPVTPWDDLVPSRSRLLKPGLRGRRVLRQAACSLQVPCLRGTQVADSNDLLTVLAIGGDWRFVETVDAVSRSLDLTIEILGVTSALPRLATSPTADVVDATGAAGLARKFETVIGYRPEWDVLPEQSLRDYEVRRRPAVVAVPHQSHGPGGRCLARRLIRQIETAVLLA